MSNVKEGHEDYMRMVREQLRKMEVQQEKMNKLGRRQEEAR